ncbi:hypothetical protein J8273_1179 [Carpediemonas membranifera]|uniref:Uncharacterized protein n=1 Tax=Carpediemonas membranifera TaxID=201153 RepID=A0A8J6BA03_9EUKA|nr:hypothetical protein J8273_1179 [Carpediemonas membranifera]|eukprot:KAG9397264.1 hypothetical protein J8273_1179 [Carpediemonas membranifera]
MSARPGALYHDPACKSAEFRIGGSCRLRCTKCHKQFVCALDRPCSCASLKSKTILDVQIILLSSKQAREIFCDSCFSPSRQGYLSCRECCTMRQCRQRTPRRLPAITPQTHTGSFGFHKGSRTPALVDMPTEAPTPVAVAPRTLTRDTEGDPISDESVSSGGKDERGCVPKALLASLTPKILPG